MILGEAQPNNGMHPTRDTTALKLQRKLGRAGDAGRSAAPVSKNQDGDMWQATARGLLPQRPAFLFA